MSVANQFPTLQREQRLAVIGHGPDLRDCAAGAPFLGKRGEILDTLLGRFGLRRDEVFLGNVCQEKCSTFDMDAREWNSEAVQAGIEQLRKDLAQYKPTMILCLGNEALHLFKQGNIATVRRKLGALWKHVWPSNVDSWRGSLFESRFLDIPTKCIATYPTSHLLRDPSLQAYVRIDVARCVEELRAGPALKLPKRTIFEYATFGEALSELRVARGRKELVSIDSEGWCSGMTVFGWSHEPGVGCAIPFVDGQGYSVFTLDEEVILLEHICDWMEDSTCPKVFQNALSDLFVFAWTYGIVVQGLQHDAMILAWEQDCEMEKGLAVLASLHTREPFWKSRENYRDRLAWVCGMDAAVTLEVTQKLLGRWPCPVPESSYLDGDFSWLTTPQAHYQFNMWTLPIMLYISLRGILFDKEGAQKLAHDLQEEIYEIQHGINQAALGEPNAAGRDCAAGRVANCGGRDSGSNDCAQPQIEPSLDPNLRAAIARFARKAPKERVEVVEERWQPMIWAQGKKGAWKWKKAGKLLKGPLTPTGEFNPHGEEPPSQPDLGWLKPKHRLVVKSVPVVIDTWEKLTRHCKLSCKGDLKRVQELLSELAEHSI